MKNSFVTITQFDSDGNIVSVNHGKSLEELHQDHLQGKCDVWCSYCYSEACEYTDSQEKLTAMEQLTAHEKSTCSTHCPYCHNEAGEQPDYHD